MAPAVNKASASPCVDGKGAGVNTTMQRHKPKFRVVWPRTYLHCCSNRQQCRECDIHEVLRRLLSNDPQDERQSKGLHCLIAQLLEQRRQNLCVSHQHRVKLNWSILHGHSTATARTLQRVMTEHGRVLTL